MKKCVALLLAVLLLIGTVPFALAEETPNPVGVIDGNAYTNDLFGFTVTFPEPWHNYSLEEIAATDDYNAGSKTLEELLDHLKTSFSIEAMHASNDASHIDARYYIYDYSDDPSITEEKFLDLLKYSYEDPNYTITEQPFLLAGQEHPGFVQTGTFSNGSVCTVEIVIQGGPYIGELFVHGSTSGNVDQLVEEVTQVLVLFESLAAESAAAGE